MKKLFKVLLPPVFVNIYRFFASHPKNDNSGWSGNYLSWVDALNESSGYDNPDILNACKNALLQVKNGTAVYERDSVIFDKKQYSWPLLAALQNIALETGRLNVLDFGGSLGSSYYQNKDFLTGVKTLSWNIVEQDKFVKCGKEFFEDETLKFQPSIDKCLEQEKPDVLLLSSVLQYLENPYQLIDKIVMLKFPYIIIDRTAFVSAKNSVLTVQTVPEEIYKAAYPAWFFNEDEFLSHFLPAYTLVADFDDSFINASAINGTRCYWKGFYLKLN